MAFKGDFIGFTFNGVHSSDLGIARVSNGDRYNEDLSPTFADRSAVIPGGDGTYFFGSSYTQKSIAIDFAFDSLSESQYRRLRQVFNTREPVWYYTDERPYKKYLVKASQSPNLKTICFNEKNQRVYKGEGTLTLVGYEPFAHGRFVDAQQAMAQNYSNYDEWISSSNLELVPSQLGWDGTKKSFHIYNAGDVDMDFRLRLNSASGVITNSNKLIFMLKDMQGSIVDGCTLQLDKIDLDIDDFVVINTKTQLIDGYRLVGSREIKTGNLYNKYKSAGLFFKIPVGEYELILTEGTLNAAPSIEYEYLYY